MNYNRKMYLQGDKGMSELVAYGNKVSNITTSIAWALACCLEFLKSMIKEVISIDINYYGF